LQIPSLPLLLLPFTVVLIVNENAFCFSGMLPTCFMGVPRKSYYWITFEGRRHGKRRAEMSDSCQRFGDIELMFWIFATPNSEVHPK
jgi:hypothetical protein